MRRPLQYLSIVVVLPALHVVFAYFSGDNWRVLLDRDLWVVVALIAVVTALIDTAGSLLADLLPHRWDRPFVRLLAARAGMFVVFLAYFFGWAHVSDGDWRLLRDGAMWVGTAIGFGTLIVWDVMRSLSDRPPRPWGSPQ